MLKQIITAAAIATGLIGATAANAQNPLHPSYKSYIEAQKTFAPVSGSVEITSNNPLQPSFYVARSTAPESKGATTGWANLDMRNPLHPSYTRS